MMGLVQSGDTEQRAATAAASAPPNLPAGKQTPWSTRKKNTPKKSAQNTAVIVAINILHFWFFMHLFVHLYLKLLGTNP